MSIIGEDDDKWMNHSILILTTFLVLSLEALLRALSSDINPLRSWPWFKDGSNCRSQLDLPLRSSALEPKFPINGLSLTKQIDQNRK